MRKIILAAVAAVVALVAVPAAAQATSVSSGHHQVTTTASTSGSSVTALIDFTVSDCNSGGDCNVKVNYFTWDASGNQLLDAVCVDFEIYQGAWAGNYCGYVGNSATKVSTNWDDIPNSGTYSPGQPPNVFENSSNPRLRLRTYGQNNKHGAENRVDGLVSMNG